MGCWGGLTNAAFRYIHSSPLQTLEDYPYKGERSHDGCMYDSDRGIGRINGYKTINTWFTDKQTALKNALAK